MSPEKIQELADVLNQARVNAAPIDQISNERSNFSRSDAYSIQEQGIKFRESQGEMIIGMKMGLTSEAKRKQMDLDSPLYGVLTDKMQVQNGGTYSLTGSIHPKIEPEIAFMIDKDLEGNVTREEVLDSCSGVYPCMEILDSRYKQFKYFSMEDVISDNSSSSHFILGEMIKNFKTINLADLKMTMKVNGEVAQEGNSVAISGDPVISVIQQCELLAERGKKLKAGSIVLAGAATIAVSLEKNMDIELIVQDLGNVTVKVGE